MCPLSPTRLAWLDTLTMAPPRPTRTISRAAYFVTSSAPRALMAITLSKTSTSASSGVSMAPPQPPQLTTPYRSRPSIAPRTLPSSVSSKGRGRAPVSSARAAKASSSRPPARTVAPRARRRRTVAPPMPPLAPVTRIVRPLKKSSMSASLHPSHSSRGVPGSASASGVGDDSPTRHDSGVIMAPITIDSGVIGD